MEEYAALAQLPTIDELPYEEKLEVISLCRGSTTYTTSRGERPRSWQWGSGCGASSGRRTCAADEKRDRSRCPVWLASVNLSDAAAQRLADRIEKLERRVAD
jgi:hypothetical protein